MLVSVLLAKFVLAPLYIKAQSANKEFALTSSKNVGFSWLFHDEVRVWLEVKGYNSDADYKREGFHPSFTYIVSKYKPIVKKIGDKYQITFTSEIAEGIP